MTTRMEFYTAGTANVTNLGLDAVGAGLKCAQSFTIGTVGDDFTFSSTYAEINFTPAQACEGTITLSIYNAYPNGQPKDDEESALATATMDSATAVVAVNKWFTFTWATPVTLVAGKQYALVMHFADTGDDEWLQIRGNAAASGYAGGSFWHTENAAAWTEVTTKEMNFTINGGEFAGTLCTLTEAQHKAGVNASSAGQNEVLLSEFVLQAESVINAVTRFDWVSAYSGLTDEVKRILNQTASDIAATYAITYDMSGYTSRVEAETMINVYRETIARGLSLLRNQEVKSFMTGDS